MVNNMKRLTGILVGICIISAVFVSYGLTEGLVKFCDDTGINKGIKAKVYTVITRSFEYESLIQEFPFAEGVLTTYEDGFVFESEAGLYVSDALFMIEHNNLDKLRSFDLSFMTLEEACNEIISCFQRISMDVEIEKAYAIDRNEYDRLFEIHKDWILNVGRDKMNWKMDDICYVIYLRQTYGNVPVYPGWFWTENIADNSPGTEIIVFLSSDGIIYTSCGWATSEVDAYANQYFIDYDKAEALLCTVYNDLLTLKPHSITVTSAEQILLTFKNEGQFVLKPFWRFIAVMDDGTYKDYLVDSQNGTVYGI